MSSESESVGAGRPFTAVELDACLKAIESLVADRALRASVSAEDRRRLLLAAGRVSRLERAVQRELARAFRKNSPGAEAEPHWTSSRRLWINAPPSVRR